LCSLYNPIKLAAGWLLSVERFLVQGEAVLVNANGGMMPLAGAMILDTVESDDPHWDDRYDDERITISRWPAGKHWYLSSNKGRVFCPAKYDSLDEARQEAMRYVPADRIKTKECVQHAGGTLHPAGVLVEVWTRHRISTLVSGGGGGQEFRSLKVLVRAIGPAEFWCGNFREGSPRQSDLAGMDRSQAPLVIRVLLLRRWHTALEVLFEL